MAVGLLLAMGMLAACSDDEARGPRESNLTLATVESRIDLATGGQVLAPSNLTVRTSAGTSTVSAEGRASTMIFEAGPQYAEVLDERGRTVMMAFASAEEPDISALSTAKALAYLALAGPWMKEAGRLKLLEEADDVAGFQLLLSAVRTQLSTNGYLDLDAASIQSAIQGVVTTAYGSASGLGAIVRPHGVLATPTTASGLSLDTTVDSKLTIQNVYLRRVSLFMRRYSHVPATGPEVKEDNPFTRVDLPNVGRYGGITGTLDGYFKGEVAYSPVQTDPALDIPRFPADAKETTYQIFAIGPGFSSHSNLNVPADIVSAQQILEVKSLFLDAFVVLLANVALPLKGDQVDEFLQFAAANAVITDIIGNLKSTIPDLADKLAAGDYYGALTSVLTSAYTSNTILPAMAQLTLDFLWANTGINADDYDMLFNGMKGMLDKMGKIDIGFTLADTFLLFHDIGKSKRIEQFVVTTTPGKVTLQAAATTIRPDQTTTIDATVQDRDPAGIYEFHWSVSPNANYWVEDRTLNGTDDAVNGILVTGESRVNIRSLITTDGAATVTCKAFRLDGGRREVGEGRIIIAFEGQLEPYEVPSSLATKVTNTKSTLDGAGRPQYESVLVTTLLVFTVTPGASYKILSNGIDNGYRLTASDIARGAPVYNPEIYYEVSQWPAPYRGNWYNLGGGKAAFIYGARTAVASVGEYRRDDSPTLGEVIATEIARQQTQIGAMGPRVYIVP